MARSRSREGSLRRIRTLSRRGEDARDPAVAVDRDGDALIVWRRFDGAKWRIQARSLASDGTLGRIATLSPHAQNDASAPQVGVDQAGNFVIVWLTNGGVWAQTRSADGVFGPLQALPGTSKASQIDLDVNAAGQAIAVWKRGPAIEASVGP